MVFFRRRFADEIQLVRFRGMHQVHFKQRYLFDTLFRPSSIFSKCSVLIAKKPQSATSYASPDSQNASLTATMLSCVRTVELPPN